MIGEPGIYAVDELDYHADPVKGGSISASDAKLILEAPARYRYRRDHGEEHRDTFDIGKAAHSLILGVGRPVEVLEFDDWRTKDAREAKAAAYAEDRVPILKRDWETTQAMAAAVWAHPIASRLLHPDSGKPEQVMVWQDTETGVWCRAMVDFLRAGNRAAIVDLKTAASADPRTFGRPAADYGYAISAAHYIDGARILGVHPDPAALFVVVEKQPPHLVSVVELDRLALTIGRERMRRAIDVWQECRETGEWPGYSHEVSLVSLPKWFEIQHEEEEMSNVPST